MLHARVYDPLWTAGPLRGRNTGTESVITKRLESFAGTPCGSAGGTSGQPMYHPEKSWEWRAGGAESRWEGYLSHLYLTYIACQVFLVLGVFQGHGVGRQYVAGGFHFIPGLLVQVL